jgi:hypothetical protein
MEFKDGAEMATGSKILLEGTVLMATVPLDWVRARYLCITAKTIPFGEEQFR